MPKSPLSDHLTVSPSRLRLIIHGAAGRMGEGILAQSVLSSDIEVIAAVDHPNHPEQGSHVVPRAPALSADLHQALLNNPDVIVDFSAPKASIKAAQAAAAQGVAFVTGTTGFDIKDLHDLEVCSRKIPLIIASNMSIGINLLHGLIAQATQALGNEWDAEVFEIHHKHKRDAPSGTALALAHTIAAAKAQDPSRTLRLARSGADALRQEDEVGLAALRGGDVVGEHTVFFFGNGERIEITHRATNRLIFVNGALRAIRWIANQDPGNYSMQDVLFS